MQLDNCIAIAIAIATQRTMSRYCIALNYGQSSINTWSCLVAWGRVHYNKIKQWVLNKCWVQT